MADEATSKEGKDGSKYRLELLGMALVAESKYRSNDLILDTRGFRAKMTIAHIRSFAHGEQINTALGSVASGVAILLTFVSGLWTLRNMCAFVFKQSKRMFATTSLRLFRPLFYLYRLSPPFLRETPKSRSGGSTR